MLESVIIALAMQCAPQVAPETILRIVSVEAAPLRSGGFNPNSLHLNRKRLSQQPQSRADAVSIAKNHISNGGTADIGLMQINSANLGALNLTVEQVFDPCTNIRAGAKILINYYLGTNSNQSKLTRLLKALSAYNTGNYHYGFKNGYVSRYLRTQQMSKQ